ncbi:MAG: diphthine--ammonia ligase, partial [Candidatus Pacearchaeota archaeon]
MKIGVLYSGGKDSTLATWLAKKAGYKIECLITLCSKNPDSFMFHTPSISKTKLQAELMDIPILIKETNGVKEEELNDLKEILLEAIKKYKIRGVVTGAIESVYQTTRIQKICNQLGIECFNPLWQRDQIEILEELIREKFRVVVIAVSAYPLNGSWLGREIDNKFLEDIKKIHSKYQINPAGEGGEFETFVIDCPLFK